MMHIVYSPISKHYKFPLFSFNLGLLAEFRFFASPILTTMHALHVLYWTPFAGCRPKFYNSCHVKMDGREMNWCPFSIDRLLFLWLIFSGFRITNAIRTLKDDDSLPTIPSVQVTDRLHVARGRGFVRRRWWEALLRTLLRLLFDRDFSIDLITSAPTPPRQILTCPPAIACCWCARWYGRL